MEDEEHQSLDVATIPTTAPTSVEDQARIEQHQSPDVTTAPVLTEDKLANVIGRTVGNASEQASLYVSVLDISPYPHVDREVNSRRKAESSCVLTSTPHKNMLMEKALSVKRKNKESAAKEPVLLCEALDFLEAGNDTLLAGWAAIFLLRRSELGQLCRQVAKIGVTHSVPPP